MSSAFSDGVTALDEALIAEPVFKSEVGLSHRRVKLERAFNRAGRAWIEEAIAKGLVTREAVEPLLAEMPEAPEPIGFASKY